jgi:hypothetical protein
MRVLVTGLLVISCTLHSAEVERITMEDGRVLIGIYDEAASAVIVKSGKITANIVIDRRRITKREALSEQEKAVLAEAVQVPGKIGEDQAGISPERKTQRYSGADLLRLKEQWAKRKQEYDNFRLSFGLALGNDPESKAHNKKSSDLKATSDASEKEYKDAINTTLNRVLPGVAEAIARREQEEAKIQEMEDASIKAAMDQILPSLMKLAPVKIVESADPTRSELDRNQRAHEYNRIIASLRGQGRSGPALQSVWGLITRPEMASLIAEFGQQ